MTSNPSQSEEMAPELSSVYNPPTLVKALQDAAREFAVWALKVREEDPQPHRIAYYEDRARLIREHIDQLAASSVSDPKPDAEPPCYCAETSVRNCPRHGVSDSGGEREPEEHDTAQTIADLRRNRDGWVNAHDKVLAALTEKDAEVERLRAALTTWKNYAEHMEDCTYCRGEPFECQIGEPLQAAARALAGSPPTTTEASDG